MKLIINLIKLLLQASALANALILHQEITKSHRFFKPWDYKRRQRIYETLTNSTDSKRRKGGYFLVTG